MTSTPTFDTPACARRGPAAAVRRAALPGAVLLAALLAAPPVPADPQRHESHVVTVRTGDADLVEADVTDLQLGESLNFVTDSGRTVDILKAPEGLEIYLDGELLNDVSPGELERKHEALLHERVEVECVRTDDGEDDCAERFAERLGDGLQHGVSPMAFVDEKVIEIVCDGEANSDCDAHAWAVVDFDAEVTSESGDREVLVIRKEIRED